MTIRYLDPWASRSIGSQGLSISDPPPLSYLGTGYPSPDKVNLFNYGRII